MDVNGTRLHLLLGARDWEAAVVPPADLDLCFDARRNTLGLRPRPFVFPTRSGASRLGPGDRRGADIDRHGNHFWIGPDRRSIHALGADHTDAFTWWPGPATEEIDTADGVFRACEPGPPTELELSGLAITDDQYLVVGALDLPVGDSVGGGLLVFDLAGGGPPVVHVWRAASGVRPFDLTAMPGGGVMILDVADVSAPGPGRLWHLDRAMRVVDPSAAPTMPAVPQVFGPLDPFDVVVHPSSGSTGVTELPLAPASAAVVLDAGWPVAVEAMADGSVLVLDRLGPDGHLAVARYRCGVRLEFEIRLDDGAVPTADFVCTDQRANTAEVLEGRAGHDLAVTRDSTGTARLLIVDDRGDQAFEFALDDHGADLVSNFHPLRLFSGKAIVAHGATASYDLGERWYPIPTQPVARFATDAVVVLAPEVEGGRAFDAGQPGTVWHRLVLDASIPPDTSITVETRAGDDLLVLERDPWQPEPAPYRRGDGSEVAYHDYEPDGTCTGQGSWELLVQRAVGRYLQVRLTLHGDGRRTPRLWAARLHEPRFSYLEQYLPDIYRDDRQSVSFLDRYLANVEGMYTTLEGRVTGVHRLVDPRTIDAEHLPWLASWVGASVESDWEPARQRLLVRHAAELFSRRGTRRGLIEAIRLATHPCPTDAIFEADARQDRFDIRIVEAFLTRTVPGVVFGDPNDLEGPGFSSSGPTWELANGGVALQQRWRAFLADRYATPGMTLAAAVAQAWGTTTSEVGVPPRFPVLTPSLPAAASDWHEFVRSELAMTYADVGSSDDLNAYRAFLIQRYRRIDDLRAAWNLAVSAGPASFAEVAFPVQLPADGAPLQDWILFVSSVLPIRRAAHRATVLVPIRFEDSDEERALRLGRVRRVVEIERPAHTVVDVAPYWAACTVGRARVGFETIVGEGSRYVDLVLGSGRLAHATVPGGSTWRLDDRVVVGRDRIERSAEPTGTGGLR